jgi:hypothetical protein
MQFDKAKAVRKIRRTAGTGGAPPVRKTESVWDLLITFAATLQSLLATVFPVV